MSARVLDMISKGLVIFGLGTVGGIVLLVVVQNIAPTILAMPWSARALLVGLAIAVLGYSLREVVRRQP